MASAVNSDVVRRGYFMKLHNLYYQAAPTFLRKVFCEMWKCINGFKWGGDKANGQKLSKIKGLQALLKKRKLQKKNVESGNCCLWDLSLLIDIILALKSENPNIILPYFDLSTLTNKNLERLKSTRNKIAHASSTEMDQATFQPLWDESVKVLTSLGMAQDDMELKTPEDLQEPAKPTANDIKAEELKKSGNQLFQNGNILKAILYYTQGLDLDDISQELLGTLYANRSAAFIETGNFGVAKDDAKSAITLRPNWFKGYTRLGRAYEKSNQFVKALINYHLAIDLGDDSEKTLDSLEYCKLMIHKLSRCEATDPEILRQKDLMHTANKDIASSFLGERMCEIFFQGNPNYLCTVAHRYYFGREGYPQSYEKAADYFAQAAQLDSAEGLYNLGRMTQEGKGVERNVFKGLKYIEEAARKPTVIKYIPGTELEYTNLGVMESWHLLGVSYQFGIAVEKDENKRFIPDKFFSRLWSGIRIKAMEFGSGMSANNAAIIYDDNGKEHFGKAVEFWKLAAYLKPVRGAENLASAYTRTGNSKLAQEWYHYAVSMGSIDKILLTNLASNPEIAKSFDPDTFKEKLQEEVETSPLLSPIVREINENRKKEPSSNYDDENNSDEAMEVQVCDKVKAILAHRQFQEVTRQFSKHHSKESLESAPPKFIVASSGIELTHMEEIFFSEIKESKEDKVFKIRVLKLKVIEDAILGRPSICLLVEDNNGDIGRLFVYYYPQTKETHEEIGYGCQFYLIYPHYRTMVDGKRGLRVDDPQLIFKQPHLRNKDRCRYCGDPKGNKVQCSKCRRVTYCSKSCLKNDAEEREHSLVCVKTLVIPGSSWACQ